jgi:hypothetical protein
MSVKGNFLDLEVARKYAHGLKLSGRRAWAKHCTSGNKPSNIPSAPAEVYKDKGWISWSDFLGTETVATYKRVYRGFESSREYVHNQDIKDRKDRESYNIYCKSGRKPDDIPSAPDRIYKNKGWISWSDFLGTNNTSTRKRKFRDFESAREFVRGLSPPLKNQEEWVEYCASGDKPSDIPSAPAEVYKDDGWVNLGDFLGTYTVSLRERDFLDFESAREFVRGLDPPLKNYEDWRRYCESGRKPSDIPSAPHTTYKNKGWKDWSDFLGTGNIATYKKVYREFESAREFVHSLDLKNQDNWNAYCLSGNKPADIPSNPDTTYKASGWVGYGDWLSVGMAAYRSGGWTVNAIRRFVASLRESLDVLEPAELYLLFQQNGLLDSQGKGRHFARALATGRFPSEEIEKFANNEPSSVDQFIDTPGIDTGSIENQNKVIDSAGLDTDGKPAGADDGDDNISDLPVIETKRVLASLEHSVFSTADAEAVEYLIASAVAKIWRHTFDCEDSAVAQAEAYRAVGINSNSDYAERVRRRFLAEYHQAKDLAIPDGYAFTVDGKLTPPNLMQRLVAVRVCNRKLVGNWSGTGAGKTLAAILTSRCVGSRLTIICCPNSVVDGWRDKILEAFPDSVVLTKTLTPAWSNMGWHRYLVLNYEILQQQNSLNQILTLIERESVDFVVIDEIHFTKQRTLKEMSQRREVVTALRTTAAGRNPELYVLGMSATPVINNLQEGKSLVEMIGGEIHDDILTRPTVSNCMTLHQRMVTVGIRQVPKYDQRYDQVEIPVDCTGFLDEIRSLGRRSGSPLALEQILIRAKLPTILDNIVPKTLIYTHNVEQIDRVLWDAVRATGRKVGFFTGEEKSGLKGFLEDDIDVLIGSSAIATGVDGLQHVCNNLVIAVLPWTAAEFEQIKGRVYRQGQRCPVTMTIPLTYADVGGVRWSWCESKMRRLRFKKSIADAVVDGVVPDGQLRSPAQAYQDVMAWLARLDSGQTKEIVRQKITIPLPADDQVEPEYRRQYFGDFSAMNNRWNCSGSDRTHERLTADPEEWVEYHRLFGEARKTWTVVPCLEMIRWCREREGLVIGDFGCGEAGLARAVSDLHTVHSFDHVAFDDTVVACNVVSIPLEDKVLDVAIFSLSLMGSDFVDYLREAHRTLKLDGWLHIVEKTSRFNDRDRFSKELKGLGFGNVEVGDLGTFTHISARKSTRLPRQDVDLRF